MKQKEQCVLYMRVSSKEQEESGFSIPAQQKFLLNYAQKKGFEVVKIFAESITAKEAGRTEFENMLKFLRKQKKPVIFCVKKMTGY